MLNNINDLLSKLYDEIDSVVKNDKEPDDNYDLNKLFVQSIRKTVDEVQSGSDSDDFKDLVLVNFMLACLRNKYTPKRIIEYISEIENLEEI